MLYIEPIKYSHLIYSGGGTLHDDWRKHGSYSSLGGPSNLHPTCTHIHVRQLNDLPKADWQQAGFNPPTFQSLGKQLHLLSYSLLTMYTMTSTSGGLATLITDRRWIDGFIWLHFWVLETVTRPGACMNSTHYKQRHTQRRKDRKREEFSCHAGLF